MLSAISQAPLLQPGSTLTRSKAQRGTPEAPGQAPPLPSPPHLPLPDPPPPRPPLHCRACFCVSPALLWAARPLSGLLWLHLLWELPPKSCSSCTCTHVHTHALTRAYRPAHVCTGMHTSALCAWPRCISLTLPLPEEGQWQLGGEGLPAEPTRIFYSQSPPHPGIWLQQIETGKHSRTRTLDPLRPKHDILALQTPFTPPSTSPPCAFL